MFELSHPDVERVLRFALDEDIGAGDITTRATVPESRQAEGRFFAREPLVLAGVELLPRLYGLRGGVSSLELHRRGGDSLSPGDCLATVRGKAWTLLEVERTALNFLQRLSGVATLARQYADAVKHTRCRILDTRKTTPGLRRLEKLAVAAGGAVNHRMGLFDAILIKNNHITAAGGVRAALERALPAGVPVEIEVRTREELEEALHCGASRLLLDNLTPLQAAEWIRFINGRATVELSGGITLETVRAYAETGADFISCGAITHSARAMDLNFRIELDAV
ncbi:MAG: Nicotinate-nucleotide pyrophosphorylase [carboxylating] [Bryobacteraceae bacterium]|nr:Nicotinate-nucleotide pyrophosphorylase [carboxylating] [Bryobacteraceae bacterium]